MPYGNNGQMADATRSAGPLSIDGHEDATPLPGLTRQAGAQRLRSQAGAGAAAANALAAGYPPWSAIPGPSSPRPASTRAGAGFSAHEIALTPHWASRCGRAAPVVGRQAPCLSFCIIHPRPAPFTRDRPGRVRAGRGRWRTVVNASQHCWKACWGQRLRSSNLLSSATLTCDNAPSGGAPVVLIPRFVSVFVHERRPSARTPDERAPWRSALARERPRSTAQPPTYRPHHTE
jgi:hypothetical protein